MGIRRRRVWKKNSVSRIFWPLWAYYFDQIMIPIYEKKHDLMESMAQLLLILFDPGNQHYHRIPRLISNLPAYINISEKCAEQCRHLRNMILRELRGYLTDKNHSENRFFDVLDNLNLIEKADAKFQEELLICDMYNVKLHEDFRRIFVVEKLWIWKEETVQRSVWCLVNFFCHLFLSLITHSYHIFIVLLSLFLHWFQCLIVKSVCRNPLNQAIMALCLVMYESIQSRPISLRACTAVFRRSTTSKAIFQCTCGTRQFAENAIWKSAGYREWDMNWWKDTEIRSGYVKFL